MESLQDGFWALMGIVLFRLSLTGSTLTLWLGVGTGTGSNKDSRWPLHDACDMEVQLWAPPPTTGFSMDQLQKAEQRAGPVASAGDYLQPAGGPREHVRSAQSRVWTPASAILGVAL